MDAHAGFVETLTERRKDIMLDEMVDRLEADRDTKIGHSALSFCQRRSGWMSHGTAHALEQDRPGHPEAPWPAPVGWPGSSLMHGGLGPDPNFAAGVMRAPRLLRCPEFGPPGWRISGG